MKASEIQIRDPYVITAADTYYLYGSTDRDIWNTGGGFDYYKSRDLVEFEGPYPAFRPDAGFWGKKNFWAPEVHFYRGRWYMFATFCNPEITRGTQILSADTPDGPFIPMGNGPITPEDWYCLDGTLFVEEGIPYLTYCHEWLDAPDYVGEIWLQRLTADLSGTVGEKQLLFRASDASWTRGQPWRGEQSKCYVTDGPFCFQGKYHLYSLWSSFADGYAVSTAISDNGVRGPWRLSDTVLRAQDSGHGMIFRGRDGSLRLALHSPNQTPHERPLFLPIEETPDGLRLIPD